MNEVSSSYPMLMVLLLLLEAKGRGPGVGEQVLVPGGLIGDPYGKLRPAT
jgi:hypothetical protein